MKNGEVLPDLYNLRKISTVFQVSSDYIIGLTNELEPTYIAPEVALLFDEYKKTLKNSVDNNEEYYWIKVEVNNNNDYTKVIQTQWCGFDKIGNEIRKPREVIPQNVIEICEKLGEPVAIINKISEIGLLYLFGGNAIIKKTLYEEHLEK